MSTAPTDAAALARSGFDALRAGDARRARDLLSRAAASGHDNAGLQVALAFACRALRDEAGVESAVDRALAQDPHNLHALILKADRFAAAGDSRAAASFYMAAVRSAPPPEQLPADLRRELARAQQMCERYAAEFESVLRGALRAKGFADSGGRFAQSLDIMLGRRQVYVQQPRSYYFPELAQVQFFDDRSLFPWMEALEAHTAAIREELAAVMREDGAFTPYVEADPRRPADAGPMAGNPAWSAFYLWKFGEPVAANAARCPRTMEAIAAVPLAHMPRRSPSVMFSLLRPGAHIPPHTGLVNTRLICHLPLIVPGECLFRVGNETRRWVEGRAWAFDDTMEHEAWNRTAATRVILLFEVWRPELTPRERELVTAMFEAIDAYSGQKPRWEI
ncbi:MAG TPA: aspartyl/asparaginyl beta-hydroxylase domain-containing protein [Usitatibacter sp.]|nr:aspartyl/asparaginyl beta-hydroxylase domain-containing protein [Usitatibacter sp.]